ncbi:hypothetical protein Tco_0725594 [Tanacetum coccineum]|uniref:Uncharacterized protein n=1 Tax=Tanacetum coccineum TaxID=301880 RepID=A0ABQ4YES3_9ASTR
MVQGQSDFKIRLLQGLMLLMLAQESWSSNGWRTVVVSCSGKVTNVDDETMFMANLTSEDPIYDETGPSYDSNTPFEVQDHDAFVDICSSILKYRDARRCTTQLVVDSDADLYEG